MTATISTATGLEDRIILVTGGTSGMGLATARHLLHLGAHVIITGRDDVRLDKAAATLDSDRLMTVRADAADMADLDRLMALIRQRYGRLDGLFANAGVGIFGPGLDMTEADFDAVVDVNFKGVFFTIQKAVPLMGAEAAIVVNASWTLNRGLSVAAAYSASKAAAHNLTRTLGAELAKRSIRINSISPGFILTDMLEADAPDEHSQEAYRVQVPLGRLGRAEDVAPAVAFLLSPSASYITAQDLVIDGGLVGAVPAG